MANGIAGGIQRAGSAFAQAIKEGQLKEQAQKEKNKAQLLQRVEFMVDQGLIGDKQTLAITLSGNKKKYGITDQEILALGAKVDAKKAAAQAQQAAQQGFSGSVLGENTAESRLNTIMSGTQMGMSPTESREAAKFVRGESGDRTKALADYQKALVNSDPKDYDKIHKLYKPLVGFRINAWDKTRTKGSNEYESDLNALSDDFRSIVQVNPTTGLFVPPEEKARLFGILKRRILDFEKRYGTKVRQWFGFSDKDMKQPGAPPSKVKSKWDKYKVQ